MAITRTAMIDDDGTGTTGTILNNAWKQELYNQIDADFETGTWTPFDLSGANLALTGVGIYQRVRQVATITLQIIYPSTLHAGAASFTLPYPAASAYHGGFYLGFGPYPLRFFAAGGTNKLDILDHANGQPRINSSLAGVNMVIHGSYFV
jgi:hypothetical protein